MALFGNRFRSQVSDDTANQYGGEGTLYSFPSMANRLGSQNLITTPQSQDTPIRDNRDFVNTNDVPKLQPVTAQSKLISIAGEMPQREDYKPGFFRKMQASIGGFGTGLTTKDASKAQEAHNEIIDRPYTRAYGDWYNKFSAANKDAGAEIAGEKAQTAEERANTYAQVSRDRGEQLDSQGRYNDARANELGNKIKELQMQLDNKMKIAQGHDFTTEHVTASKNEMLESVENIKKQISDLHNAMMERVAGKHDDTTLKKTDKEEQGKTARHNTPQATTPKINTKIPDYSSIEDQLFRTAPAQHQQLFQEETKLSGGKTLKTGKFRLLPRSAIADNSPLMPAWRNYKQQAEQKAGGTNTGSRYTVEPVQ